MLGRHGVVAMSVVRMLSDEELGRSGVDPFRERAPISAQQIIERVLIGHLEHHRESIRATIEGGTFAFEPPEWCARTWAVGD